MGERQWQRGHAGAAWQRALDLAPARTVGDDVAIALVRTSGFAGASGEAAAGAAGGFANATPVAMLLFPENAPPRIEVFGTEEIPVLLAGVENLEEKLAARLAEAGRALTPEAELAISKLRLSGIKTGD